MTEQPTPTDRIKINPSEEERAGLERYLEVSDLPDGEIRARLWTYVRFWDPITPNSHQRHPRHWAPGAWLILHSRDWCALFDWWAVNKWAMEGEDEPSKEDED